MGNAQIHEISRIEDPPTQQYKYVIFVNTSHYSNEPVVVAHQLMAPSRLTHDINTCQTQEYNNYQMTDESTRVKLVTFCCLQ
jgi:hypothetical protein